MPRSAVSSSFRAFASLSAGAVLLCSRPAAAPAATCLIESCPGAAATSAPAAPPKDSDVAERRLYPGRRERQHAARLAKERDVPPARSSARQHEVSMFPAQHPDNSITLVASRKNRQIFLPAKRVFCGVQHRDRRVNFACMRAQRRSGVAFDPTHRRELELPSAAVAESAKSKNGVCQEEPPPGERGRDRFVFAAPLLGGLTQGASVSDPSTSKRRTDAELGRFYFEEIYFGSWGPTGSAPTFFRVFVRVCAVKFLASGRLTLDT